MRFHIGGLFAVSGYFVNLIGYPGLKVFFDAELDGLSLSKQTVWREGEKQNKDRKRENSFELELSISYGSNWIHSVSYFATRLVCLMKQTLSPHRVDVNICEF